MLDNFDFVIRDFLRVVAVTAAFVGIGAGVAGVLIAQSCGQQVERVE